MLFRNLTPTHDWQSSLSKTKSASDEKLLEHPVRDAKGMIVGHVSEALTEDTGVVRYLIVSLTEAAGRRVLVPMILADVDSQGIQVQTLTGAQLAEMEPYTSQEPERTPNTVDTTPISSTFSETEIQAARALLLPPSRVGKALGLNPPVSVGGPPIEDVLRGHRGADG